MRCNIKRPAPAIRISGAANPAKRSSGDAEQSRRLRGGRVRYPERGWSADRRLRLSRSNRRSESPRANREGDRGCSADYRCGTMSGHIHEGPPNVRLVSNSRSAAARAYRFQSGMRQNELESEKEEA